MFNLLSYCSGQNNPYILARNFAKLMMSSLAKSDSISELSLSKTAGSKPSSNNFERILAAAAFAAKRSAAPSFIPGAGQISISRSMIRIFSFLNSLKTPSCNCLDTSETTTNPSFDNSPRAIPKFPEVASITVCPLFSLPVTIASWTM